MFRNDYRNEATLPYFKEVRGPWTVLSDAVCAVAGDLDGDGRDDLVVCNKDSAPFLFVQRDAHEFRQLAVAAADGSSYVQNWRNARIVDVTGDGTNDLVVVTDGQPSWLYVFRGRSAAEPTFFDFDRPAYQLELPYASRDVEVLDANDDGIPDLYVVQVDEAPGEYCANGGRGYASQWWGGGPQPPRWWTPPRDRAGDVLLLGTEGSFQGSGGDVSAEAASAAAVEFTKIPMQHSEPGCGSILHRMDKRTLVVGQGSHAAAGHTLILFWG